jgi:hypothetical protein
MAEKSRYPQIPSTVWWGVRSILIKSPKTTIDERLLGIELKVQAAAAKQYITELVAVGILAEDKKATPLAEKWRLDATYKGAVSELIASVYPQSLRDVAPADGADRQKAVAWFLQEGLGEGSAKNKAATYFLLGTPDPNESPARSTSAKGAVYESIRTTPAMRNAGAAKKVRGATGRSGKNDNQRHERESANSHQRGRGLRAD